jgi:hypothetical protein
MAIILNANSGITTPGAIVTGLTDVSGAAAGQIKFPTTQNASTDVNTLDDYKEGTWTPTTGAGVGGTITSTSGGYTKIGRQVTVQGAIFGTGLTTSAGGILVSNLPFTAANFVCCGSIIPASSLTGGVINSPGGGGAYLNVDVSLTSTTALYFSITYFTA